MTKESQTMNMFNVCLLHSKADRALRMAVARELESYGVTMMQWLLLSTVNRSTGGMRMSELAAALDVTMPQITALMNDLVERKLAKQKINSTDRRSRRLMVTSLGKRQLEQLEPAVDEGMKKWLHDIPAADLKGYFATVRAMAEQSARQD